MRTDFVYATHKHFEWLKARDNHISEVNLKHKISAQEIIVAESEDVILGWLRFGFFWDSIPFMNMLYIEDRHRGEGIGKRLLEFWESEMKKQNHKFIMTSSQANEDAQHFYRKFAYSDVGSFTLPGEPQEYLFVKRFS